MTDLRIPQFLPMRDGINLFVKDHGRGPTVIFVHGWPLNADVWDRQRASIRPLRSGVIPTTPGSDPQCRGRMPGVSV